ncbi:hypothetical protein WN944_028785 [Citrus x changshan-huyou]|uniref:Uncharacterized protein n=1 Tax=Citrus x changshan-huyou TaxID=2935761 RepID=A0AAP0QE92_9ROSI
MRCARRASFTTLICDTLWKEGLTTGLSMVECPFSVFAEQFFNETWVTRLLKIGGAAFGVHRLRHLSRVLFQY